MLRYAVPITLGAFLLFQVQPLIARHILPWFGGTPAVWTTCMLFFQLLLLGGYAYSHLLVCRLSPRRQAGVHTVIIIGSLALLLLLARSWGAPLLPAEQWRPVDSSLPILRIVLLLGIAVGLPYLILATTSPMLQAWFSRVYPGVSPYRLYTLSNIGSLLALVTYPVVMEPHFTLRSQAWIWGAAYVLFVVGYVYCAVRGLPRGADADAATCPVPETETEPEADGPPSLARRWAWVLLPALASLLLLAITNQMCQEVAVIPFLWVLPLSLYLLSFIICFDNPRWYARLVYLPLLMAALVGAAYITAEQENLDIRLQIGGLSLALFAACMVCHGELVALKPAPRYLTGFYLAVAVGGALGGLFVGVLAPVVFRGFWELPVGLALAWLVGLAAFIWRSPLPRRAAPWVGYGLLGVTIGLPFVPLVYPLQSGEKIIYAGRNFYGVLKVREDYADEPLRHRHTLVHGRIIHGWQFVASAKRRLATSYYSPTSGMGMTMANHPRRVPGATKPLRFGVLGLGVGTLAAFMQEGDYLRFYEINPEVLRIAEDTRYYTYLSQCPAKVDVIMGDGRISLERELQAGEPQRFDVLALDAFSSDSVPCHLLTKEAFEIYVQHLRDENSVIAVDISNRVLDLQPVVFALGQNLGWDVLTVHDPAPEDRDAFSSSDWMLLTRCKDPGWVREMGQYLTKRGEVRMVRMWTDDYHNLFQIMK